MAKSAPGLLHFFKQNEALAQDSETAVVWQKSGPLGPQYSAMLLASSVTLCKSLGNEGRKVASTE